MWESRNLLSKTEPSTLMNCVVYIHFGGCHWFVYRTKTEFITLIIKVHKRTSCKHIKCVFHRGQSLGLCIKPTGKVQEMTGGDWLIFWENLTSCYLKSFSISTWCQRVYLLNLNLKREDGTENSFWVQYCVTLETFLSNWVDNCLFIT